MGGGGVMTVGIIIYRWGPMVAPPIVPVRVVAEVPRPGSKPQNRSQKQNQKEPKPGEAGDHPKGKRDEPKTKKHKRPP